MTAVFKYGNVNLLIIRVCDCIWNKIIADKYLMGGHKLHWHLNKVIDCKEGKPIVPVTIDMEDRYNLRSEIREKCW